MISELHQFIALFILRIIINFLHHLLFLSCYSCYSQQHNWPSAREAKTMWKKEYFSFCHKINARHIDDGVEKVCTTVAKQLMHCGLISLFMIIYQVFLFGLGFFF